jgi:hypothetical protein
MRFSDLFPTSCLAHPPRRNYIEVEQLELHFLHDLTVEMARALRLQ